MRKGKKYTKQSRNRRQKRRTRRRGGGNFRGDQCDLTPIRLSDFTPENLAAWRMPLSIDIATDDGVAESKSNDVESTFNLIKLNEKGMNGQYNAVNFVTCKTNNNPRLVFRSQNIMRDRATGGGGPSKRPKLLSVVVDDVPSEEGFEAARNAKIDEAFNNHIEEMKMQCELSTLEPQLSPHVYMIGMNNINNNLSTFSISQAMNSNVREVFFSNSSNSNYIALFCMRIESLLSQISQKTSYIFFDLRANNFVYSIKGDVSVYIIDLDPQYTMKDTELDVNQRACVMILWFYLHACVFRVDNAPEAYYAFLRNKVDEYRSQIGDTIQQLARQHTRFNEFYRSVFVNRVMTMTDENLADVILELIGDRPMHPTTIPQEPGTSVFQFAR